MSGNGLIPIGMTIPRVFMMRQKTQLLIIIWLTALYAAVIGALKRNGCVPQPEIMILLLRLLITVLVFAAGWTINL